MTDAPHIDSTTLDATLQAWIEQAAQLAGQDLLRAGVDGHCDAFAMAFMACCARYLPDAKTELVVISRERMRYEQDGAQVIDHNRLSHVIVDVDGILVDVHGVNADQRWEDNWIQPCDDPEGDDNEEDIFSYASSSAADMAQLRLSWSSRTIDGDKVQAFEQALAQGWMSATARTQLKRRIRPA